MQGPRKTRNILLHFYADLSIKDCRAAISAKTADSESILACCGLDNAAPESLKVAISFSFFCKLRILFAGSVGRTDFPGSDHATLIRSIHEQLLTLDDSVRVLPGHGEETTIGRERRTNPFLNER